MSQLAEELRAFIDENFLFGVETKYTDDDSLLESSIVDSTGVLELITHIEGTYDILIEDEELVPENLDSINALVQYITKKVESREALGAS